MGKITIVSVTYENVTYENVTYENAKKKPLNSSKVRQFLSLHFHRLQKQSLLSPYKSL